MAWHEDVCRALTVPHLGRREDHLVAHARGAAHDDAQADPREHVRGAAHARPEALAVRQLEGLCTGSGLNTAATASFGWVHLPIAAEFNHHVPEATVPQQHQLRASFRGGMTLTSLHSASLGM